MAFHFRNYVSFLVLASLSILPGCRTEIRSGDDDGLKDVQGGQELACGEQNVADPLPRPYDDETLAAELNRAFPSCWLGQRAPGTRNQRFGDFKLAPDGKPLTQVMDTFNKLQSPTHMSRTKLVTDNVSAWHDRWRMLNLAKNSIDSTYFNIENDWIGRAFLGHLLRKAEEWKLNTHPAGKRITLVYDGRGSNYMTTAEGKRYMAELANAGVRVAIFRPFNKHLVKSIFNFIGDRINGALGMPGSSSGGVGLTPEEERALNLTTTQGAKDIVSSNHDKIIVIDDSISITGGRNIAEPYHADPREVPTAWRDSDVVMDTKELAAEMSEAVNVEFDLSLEDASKRSQNEVIAPQHSDDVRAELLFMASGMDRWMTSKPEERDAWVDQFVRVYRTLQSVHGEDIGDAEPPEASFRSIKFDPAFPAIRWQHLKNFMAGAADSGAAHNKLLAVGYDGRADKVFSGERPVPTKILDKRAADSGHNEITESVISLIEASQKEIILQNPYVIISDAVWQALKRADDRGVKILIHTNSPQSTDSLMTQAFFINDWTKILSDFKNLEIWAFTGIRKLHAKVFVFDRKVAAVGTYNLDSLSEQHNSEIVSMIGDADFAMRTALRIEYEDMGFDNEGKPRSERFWYRSDFRGETAELGPMRTIEGQISKELTLKIYRKLTFLRPII